MTRQQPAFVGLLEDRCLSLDAALGTVCLIDQDRVATCAHLVVPYLDKLSALKVRFAQANREFGVAEALFHPYFDLKQAAQLSERALREKLPSLALQKHNIVVLRLTDQLGALSDDDKRAVNSRLSADPITDQGLSGQLEEVDLALVIQTLTNGRRSGSLVICDERNLPRARMFCQDGRVCQAQFGPLENERAIYQIFNQHLTGKFYFTTQEKADWSVSGTINRPTDMLLIEAHRRMDEIPALLLELGGEEVLIGRTQADLDLSRLSPDVHADAQALWPHLDGTVPVGRLWRVARLDDYAVFKPLVELLGCGQVTPYDVLAHAAELRPVQLGRHLPLKPWDAIDIFGFDCGLDAARYASGKLLGTLAPGDPDHLIHNLNLPGDAAGAPVLKEGLLIGVHCGALPIAEQSAVGKSLSQFIWSDALFECGKPPVTIPPGRITGSVRKTGQVAKVKNTGAVFKPKNTGTTAKTNEPVPAPGSVPPPAPQQELAEAMVADVSVSTPAHELANSESTGNSSPAASQPSLDSQPEVHGNLPGCLELAQVECPKCGGSSLESARFCKICGQPLIDDIVWEPASVAGRFVRPLTAALVAAVILLLAAVSYIYSPAFHKQRTVSGGNGVSSTLSARGDSPLTLELQRADRTAGRFVSLPAGDQVRPSDLLRVRITVEKNLFVYVLYQGSSSKTVQLQYPENPEDDTVVLADSVVTLPRERNAHELSGFALGGPAGTDTLLVIASPAQLPLIARKEDLGDVFSASLNLLAQAKSTTLATTTKELRLSKPSADRQLIYVGLIKFTHDI